MEVSVQKTISQPQTVTPASAFPTAPIDGAQNPASPALIQAAAAPSGALNFDVPAKPIAELVTHPDFPKSALGEHVDIGGYCGVLVDIVKNSIKVRSAEGNTMSYNINALRRLYGPHPPAESIEAPQIPEPAVVAPSQPKRHVITNPNFDVPAKDIEESVHRSDFPNCVFGQLIDLHGYTGVVVEIVGRSLKVRSREGTTRSYNADGLRKIYATRVAPPG